MSKYSEEFKLKVINYCLEKNCGHKNAAKFFSISSAEMVREWLKKYKQHGIKSLKAKKMTPYSGEFKKDVVEYMHKNHLSYAETSFYFNIGNHSTVGNWDKIYCKKGPQALYKKQCGVIKNMSSNTKKAREQRRIKVNKVTSSDEELLTEIQQLRMENAYLKKLQALVQERTKPQQKRKY